MIDVVFLLLVFFMLSARFGVDLALPLPLAGGAGDWTGPPRLVDVAPDGLSLNGVATTPEALVAALAQMTETPEDPVILRGRDGADLQRLIDVAAALSSAGHVALVLAE